MPANREVTPQHDCQSIVFEPLWQAQGAQRLLRGPSGSGRSSTTGSSAESAFFAKYTAHVKGIRLGRVTAEEPLRRFDGSGTVHRIGNRQIVVLSMGQKIFNGLRASYNIADRYWISEHGGNSKSLDRKVASRSRREKLFVGGKTSTGVGRAHEPRAAAPRGRTRVCLMQVMAVEKTLPHNCFSGVVAGGWHS
jgi:hypothetical protein